MSYNTLINQNETQQPCTCSAEPKTKKEPGGGEVKTDD